jgi:NAD(P)-dependent dehydrogenase (short-subunit alcohol dehydrogenase family)
MTFATRTRLLITGAAGGMGRACARLLGSTHDLVLTDVAQGPLDGLAEELRLDGYTVVTARAGDLNDQALLDALVGDLDGDMPFKLVHTAGLSPSLGDWRAIMTINLIATDKLLNTVEPALRPGSCAVVIASTAGHMRIPAPGVNELLDAPQAPGFLDGVGAMIEAIAAQSPAGPGGISYSFSKAAVIRQCERRAIAWGERGARIVTISPGLILTPMGRSELEKTEGAAQLRDAAPVGRAGTSMDIALAARFLLSDEASFITGTDLKVDGGSVAAINRMMGR